MRDQFHVLEREVRAAVARERDAAGALGVTIRLLKDAVPYYSWIGIYRLEEGELVLGPFLGKPSPQERIPAGRGICGAAAAAGTAQIVDDVHADPRYLAWIPDTRSEIVVPILAGERVVGAIDVQSDTPAAFTSDDRMLLETVAEPLSGALKEALGRTITLIPGDGIGPEVTDAVLRILGTAGFETRWERHDAGIPAIDRTGQPLPPELIESIRRTRVALKGPVTTPIGQGFTSVNVGLRKALGLYANLRPVVNLPGVRARYDNVDLIIVRENTEDLYAGLEHQVVPGVVESLKIITELASTRVARFAFEHARRHGRRRVTGVHKANIMKLGDGLFLDSVRKVAREYQDIVYDERIVDATCMHLVIDPGRFDVLLMPNLYGDIVSDLCAGLVGGLGVVGSANLGDQAAVFEAVHGSAPDIAGQNLANPTALLLSSLLMLRHLGAGRVADAIFAALVRVLTERQVKTRDLGGSATTREFADAVCREIRGA